VPEQETAHTDNSLTVEQRRAFLKMPLDDRRRLMSEQAERLVHHYDATDESDLREEWQGGDIVDY
jgi:hypothetical protein